MPLIQAGLRHPGFALIDVLSPCVTFNDHEGSTKSYAYTREHYHPAVEADYVPRAETIAVDYAEGESLLVPLHDGTQVHLRKLETAFDTGDRAKAYAYIDAKLREGEYVTGLIHEERAPENELHAINRTAGLPLNTMPYARLNPGQATLSKLMARYR